jgi:hypothetical protein
MSTIKNIGVIGYQLSEEFFTASRMDDEKFLLKKLFSDKQLPGVSMKRAFPDCEIVDDITSITGDESIDLVIVSPDHLQYAKVSMEAGKPTRVI